MDGLIFFLCLIVSSYNSFVYLLWDDDSSDMFLLDSLVYGMCQGVETS
jgi:hypothetical protein